MISPVKPGNLGQNVNVTSPQQQQQINRNPGVVDVSDIVPRGMPAGSIGLNRGDSNFSFFLGVGQGKPQQIGPIPNAATDSEQFKYLPWQEGNGAPTTANYPSSGDHGYYRDLATSYVYLDINHSGTLYTQNLETLAGVITAAQHSYLGAATASTMHSMVQITGTITAAQHGNFTAATANDSLHALATTAFNGFLSTSGFSLLTNATNASTPDNLARRTAAGNCNFRLINLDSSTSQLQIDGTKVLGPRQTGWGSPSGTLTRTAFTTASVTYSGTAAATYDATQIQTLMDAVETCALELRRSSPRLGALITDGISTGWIGA